MTQKTGSDNESLLIVPEIREITHLHCNGAMEPWTGILPEKLTHHMGDVPLHFPPTQFKAAYDRDSIHVFFQVEDRYVRALTDQYQGPVYQDSCVEFFFSPGPTADQGYFNLEINCCGAALFEFHPSGKEQFIRIPESTFRHIGITSSLTGRINEEITTPLTWTAAFRLPVEILKEYTAVLPPGPGNVWRANFHKCADRTSHPHWLTWAPIHYPTPRFHLPQYFGFLKFI